MCFHIRTVYIITDIYKVIKSVVFNCSWLLSKMIVIMTYSFVHQCNFIGRHWQIWNRSYSYAWSLLASASVRGILVGRQWLWVTRNVFPDIFAEHDTTAGLIIAKGMHSFHHWTNYRPLSKFKILGIIQVHMWSVPLVAMGQDRLNIWLEIQTIHVLWRNSNVMHSDSYFRNYQLELYY